MKFPVKSGLGIMWMLTFGGCAPDEDMGVDMISSNGDDSVTSESKQLLEWGKSARFGEFSTFAPNALPELYWAGGSVRDGSSIMWDNWHKVPNAQPGLGSGLGGVGQAIRLGERTDVFYIGSGGTVAHSYLDSATWYADDWGKPTGYNLFGHVGAASWGSDRVDIFVLGTTSPLSDSSFSYANVKLFHRSWTPSGPSGWTSWGTASAPMGYVNSGVSAVSWSGTRIDVFGKNPGGAGIKHWYSTNGSTYGSDTWPTAYTEYGAPSAVSWGDQRLDVFYRGGSNSTYEVRHLIWDHGVFLEDSWGSPCPSWWSFLQGATATKILGEFNFIAVQAEICANTDPDVSPLRIFEGISSTGWMNPAPGYYIPGLWSFSVYGSGAILAW